MNLILRPLDNPNDPVWSVIFMVFLSVDMAVYVIIYILGIDEREEHGSHDTPKQEELLQLPSIQRGRLGILSCIKYMMKCCNNLDSNMVGI